jgi:hypothetical protein
MELFFMHKKKNGEKIQDYLWGFFWCGVMNIHNNKLFHDTLKKLGENHTV